MRGRSPTARHATLGAKNKAREDGDLQLDVVCRERARVSVCPCESRQQLTLAAFFLSAFLPAALPGLVPFFLPAALPALALAACFFAACFLALAAFLVALAAFLASASVFLASLTAALALAASYATPYDVRQSGGITQTVDQRTALAAFGSPFLAACDPQQDPRALACGTRVPASASIRARTLAAAFRVSAAFLRRLAALASLAAALGS